MADERVLAALAFGLLLATPAAAQQAIDINLPDGYVIREAREITLRVDFPASEPDPSSVTWTDGAVTHEDKSGPPWTWVRELTACDNGSHFISAGGLSRRMIVAIPGECETEPPEPDPPPDPEPPPDPGPDCPACPEREPTPPPCVIVTDADPGQPPPGSVSMGAAPEPDGRWLLRWTWYDDDGAARWWHAQRARGWAVCKGGDLEMEITLRMTTRSEQ